jgi:hypothetical protein
MKKIVTKKLSLSRETLVRLDDRSLSIAAGGSSESLTEPSCRHCPTENCSAGCTTTTC